MMPKCLGRPTIEGNTARGASSPANPALHMPEPLSTTRAWTSSSAMGKEGEEEEEGGGKSLVDLVGTEQIGK
uniref:Uncharacterized protein n=1 Tax=Hyaloperonospora arabidopsidis (strain Emoy2) TaxID=559515 RepID=M4BMS8_HYAAE